MLHAVPDAAEIDCRHAIEFLAAGVRGFHCGRLHAGIVECRVQPAEGGDRPLDHGGHLSLVCDVTDYAGRLVAGRSQLVRGGA